MSGPAPKPLLDRWLAKVVIDESGCWLWTGRHDKDGYARIDVGSRSEPGGWRDKGAHIVAWELHHGCPVPEGFVVHHRCENKGCVNPEHLEAKRRAQHQSEHQIRETCRSGQHSMSAAYVGPSGKRQCRPCSAERARRNRAARRTLI